MPVIAIYNNKGGEGKSTVTVGLAEFLAARKNKSVLVIDLDAQSSSSCALLGQSIRQTVVAEGKTSADLMAELRGSRKPLRNLERFLCWRSGTESRGFALGELAVLVPHGPRMFELEEEMNWRKETKLMRDRLKPALCEFDYVLIDLPANVKKSSTFCVNGLVMSDFILIPTRSTRISLEAMPLTFEMIDYVRELGGQERPAVLGFLLNATDKRRQQYQANFPAILDSSRQGELPPVFKQHWPSSPALESATDASRKFQTLKERFGSSYDQARLATRELEKKCSEYRWEQAPLPPKKSIWQRLGFA
jgi:chromosome partitioning protein